MLDEPRRSSSGSFPRSSAATACGRSTTTARRCWRRCARSRRRRRPDPTIVRAHAGRLQLGLLRARLPRPADGHRAGRGPRPRRPRQRRLHADDARAAPRRRHLPPRRRRLPRPAGVPARLAPRRARACSTRTAPATWRSPTRSAPASPTTRRSTPTCRRSSATTSARTPILPNVDDLSSAATPTQRSHVLEHLDELVVKAVGESGGYGMLIGPHSTAAERDEFRERILADPRNYIAQPTLALSQRAVLRRRPGRAAARRPAAVRPAHGETRHGRARRPDARGAATRLAGRQLVAGRRQQGHLGAPVMPSAPGARFRPRTSLAGAGRGRADRADALTRRGQPLLDEPLPRARRAHRAAGVDVNLNLTLDRTPDGDGGDWGRLVAQPADRAAAERSPVARRHGRRGASTSRAPTRSPRASRRRARTPGRCASRSAPRCGRS